MTTTFPAGSILFHRRNVELDGLADALLAQSVVIQPVDRFVEVASCDRPAVVIGDQDFIASTPDLADLPDQVMVLKNDDGLTLDSIRTAFQLSVARLDTAHAQHELEQLRKDVRDLNRAGMALMAERNLEALLALILDAAMRITRSDAGAIFLVEKHSDGTSHLRFKVIRIDSVATLPALEEYTFPINSSTLAGHVAQTREPLVLDDVNDLPPDAVFRHSDLIKKLVGYSVKSMLITPMVDHEERVVGLLQLGNRKSNRTALLQTSQDVDRYVVPYATRDSHVCFSLAGQAAVSIENASLHEQVEHLFESFARAAVTAIDQRDPATAGHSLRVATLVVNLAQAMERIGSGRYRDVRFTRDQLRELRYAALLHDFGKIGVREEVLVKARKLPSAMWERMQARFELIRLSLDLEYERKRLRMTRTGAGAPELVGLASELGSARQDLDRFYTAVRAANDPSLSLEESPATLLEMSEHVFQRPDGTIEAYLNERELHFLQIPRGTLDDRERREIEAHAQQTFQFLAQMPWTDDLKHVPEYAAAHHEKLDGSGYPHHLKGDAIPLQTRIMTVADIFDALTAHDRPYKHAVPPHVALDIIQSEARTGMLDEDVVQVLIDSRVYLTGVQ